MPPARAAAYERSWGDWDWDTLGTAKWAVMDSNCLLMLSSCKRSGRSCRDTHADVTRSHARSRVSTEITVVFADFVLGSAMSCMMLCNLRMVSSRGAVVADVVPLPCIGGGGGTVGTIPDPHCHPLPLGGRHAWRERPVWQNACRLGGQESNRSRADRGTTGLGDDSGSEPFKST